MGKSGPWSMHGQPSRLGDLGFQTTEESGEKNNFIYSCLCHGLSLFLVHNF